MATSPAIFLTQTTYAELAIGFKNLVDWRKEGVLPNGEFKEVYRKFLMENGFTYYDYPMHQFEKDFLFEIARRTYEVEVN